VSENLHITSRDHEILLGLVRKVRLFSQRQIADHWFGGELVNARRRLGRLAQRALLARLNVQARPAPPIDAPLVSWQPQDPAPDFGQIAYRCQQRWRHRPTRPCTVWTATERAAQFFGGVGRGDLKNPLQATHDLGVAAVWLRLTAVAPHWAAAWRSEDLLAHTRRGEKLPDAFIVDEAEQVQWVIEFAGGYDTERVEAFHRDCAARGLPYQLW
jgi:hypothetical protein